MVIDNDRFDDMGQSHAESKGFVWMGAAGMKSFLWRENGKIFASASDLSI